MINPVNTDTQKNKYHDPLNKTVPVLMSYSNEVGTAISEIAPKLGTALWAPSLMYLGADIYDKYKNDKDHYKPSGKRAIKRAIFQGLTSLIALPALIFAAQCLVSPIARIGKFKISGNAKDTIYRHTKNVIDQARPSSLTSYENFEELIVKTLKNKIESRNNEKKTINIFKRLYNSIFTNRYSILNDNIEKIEEFAKHNAKNTFKIMTALQEGNTKEVPHKILKKYNKILPLMKEAYKDGDYAYQASRSALKEYQNILIFKNKFLKTITGFAALLIFAKPINNFIDKKIMKKYINPGIDQISSGFVNQSKLKDIFNTMSAQQNIILNPKNVQTSNLLQKLMNQRGLKLKAGESQ